jgi:protein gp37
MGKDSKIEWTHHTFNPWWGCVEISPACAHCYAKAFAKRTGHDVWGADKPRRFFDDPHWLELLKWDKAAADAGERHRVFCGSMCDIFEAYEGPSKNELQAARENLFYYIHLTPHLQWLLLTKRPERMIEFAPASWLMHWPDNVTAMTTVENQEQADLRIPELLKVPAKTRGLSMEPLLEFVTFPRVRTVDWIIVGGESGAGEKSRMTHPAWVRWLRDYCREVGTAFFFKQWGDWLPFRMGHAYIDGFHEAKVLQPSPVIKDQGWPMYRVGKAKAGRLLDELEHNELPAF